MDPKEIWQTVLGEIELQISRPNFLTWLKQSELLNKDEKEGTALVGLPNNFAKEWVRNRYHKIILGSLRNIDGSIKNIDYVVVNHTNQTTQLNQLKKPRGTKSPSVPQPTLLETRVDPKTNLNPKYTLDSFVVGSSNELAYAAIQAVTKDVGRKYNPLFVYGGVGLGKTHLIQAGGNEIVKNHGSKNVLYVSSEKFINDVVWAIRNKRMEDMKRKYRDTDVLIIDDIQFIGGKASTEQEFFYTFNVLHENSKQIIISSDRPPAAIPTLEERLRSRFEGGMIVDIGYPDYEMRLAILRTKVQDHGWVVEEKTLESIATKVQRNIRELEGVLNKVVFYEQYKNEKIDAKKLDEIISETTQLAAKNITVGNVVNAVAEFFEVSASDLTGRSRKSEVVEPRQICMYLLRDILKLSYPHIGEKLGNRDHTTAIHACEKITKDINQNPSLNQKIMLIKERLYKNGG
ncbi:MAG TPA: chromosomal replication initiator protein DnaA [Candidatus Paceibacterota bacterium]|nr:chromosomal replication initiator protein DnaA [Candidatus Paceibacterota bacterium]